MSCISVVSYPLGKEEVGGGHIPFPEGRRWCRGPWAIGEGAEGAQFLMASAQSVSDSAFNLPSHSQGLGLSATHPLHPHLTVTAAQIAPHCPAMLAADLPPPPHPRQHLFLSMKSLAGKTSSLSLSPPEAMPSCIVHCSVGSFLA